MYQSNYKDELLLSVKIRENPLAIIHVFLLPTLKTFYWVIELWLWGVPCLLLQAKGTFSMNLNQLNRVNHK